MKKVLGVVFILFGAIFSLLILLQLPSNIISINKILNANYESSYSAGMIFGIVEFQLILLAFAISFWYFGLKWVKRKS